MLCLLMQPRRGVQLHLQTNNKNCQKSELYGSLTTKDLKKPHSSRQVGGEKLWRWAERLGDKVWCPEETAASEWRVPQSLMVDKNQEGYLESE